MDAIRKAASEQVSRDLLCIPSTGRGFAYPDGRGLWDDRSRIRKLAMCIPDTEFCKNALRSPPLVTGWEAGTPSYLNVLAIPNYRWVTGTWRVTSVSVIPINSPLSIGLSSSNPFKVLVVRWRKNWGFRLNLRVLSKIRNSSLFQGGQLPFPASLPCADSLCSTRLGRLHEPLPDPHTILTLCLCVYVHTCACLYTCTYLCFIVSMAVVSIYIRCE